MKHYGIAVTVLFLLGALLMPCSRASAAMDSVYTLAEVSATWDATYANRNLAPITAPSGSSYQYDYDHTYGDEAVVTYSLPWSFTFYGQTYSQIKADTNGNIWFTATGSAHSFNLASTGHGPVIAAWNNDHSSYYYGGVFVQHKTDPERVIIEWQTESYTEQGSYRPNNFEVVLYRDGSIRTNYNTIATTAGKDFGSGISKGDGSSFLGLPANYGNDSTLQGRSFLYQLVLLTVDFTGTGTGAVTSSPAGIACNSRCSAPFQPGGVVTLIATPVSSSSFAGWQGACTGTAPCQVTMNANKAVTATFNILPPVAAFSASPTTGGTPFITTITNQSQRAASWSWNFGDGTISSEQNPTHVYKTPGSYTVTLTVTNASGTSTASKTITASTCQNQPVRILETNVYYPSLATALGAATDGQTIQLQEWNFAEGATISKTVTLDGGYDCGFASKTGRSVLEGELHTSGGTVRMKDVRITGTTPSTLPVISVAPASDSFGSVILNTLTATHTFTVTNIGGANLTINNTSLSGTNLGDYNKSADTCSGRALTPGTSCSVQATFRPAAIGARTAVLAITSNDPATPTKNVTLNGTGVLPALTILKTGTGTGTVSSLPAGISCGSSCSGSFATGTVVTLTALPDSSNVFAGWSGGGCSGTGTCAITMSANTTVTATFKKNYSLNLVISGTGGGTVTSVPPNLACNANCSGTYVSSDQVTLVPSPYEYSYFSGWTNGPCAGTGNCTLVMNANTTVTSNFDKDIQHQVRIDVGSTPSYFSTIQSALNAATTGATIKLWGTLFSENVIFSGTKAIDLQGGYNAAFTAVSGRSTINGRLTINSGSKLNVDNLTIEPAAP
jgi:PKD repeat protein